MSYMSDKSENLLPIYDEADVFLGAGRFSGSENICKGDSYYYRSREQKWGSQAWADAVETRKVAQVARGAQQAQQEEDLPPRANEILQAASRTIRVETGRFSTSIDTLREQLVVRTDALSKNYRELDNRQDDLEQRQDTIFTELCKLETRLGKDETRIEKLEKHKQEAGVEKRLSRLEELYRDVEGVRAKVAGSQAHPPTRFVVRAQASVALEEVREDLEMAGASMEAWARLKDLLDSVLPK